MQKPCQYVCSVYNKVRGETEVQVHEAMEAALRAKEVKEVDETKEVHGIKLKSKSDLRQ